MAKKKKVANTRGYATTSLPSKKSTTPDTTKSNETTAASPPPPTTQNTTSQLNQPTTTTTTTTTVHTTTPNSQQPTELDDVTRLVKRFENLHAHKSNMAIEKLGQSAVTSTVMSDLNIKEQPFSLKSEIEQDILNVITDQQKTFNLGAFCRPIRRRASQTEKDRVVGKMDVVYLALKKLGFDPVDIEESLRETVSTEMDDHLDWLCLNVPYERMPIGYFDTYFTKEGVKISLEQAKAMNDTANSNGTDNDATINVPPSITLSPGNAAKTDIQSTTDDDHKRRILEAAQSYMYDDDDDDEPDINQTYARTKLELTELETQVHGDSNGKKKKKKQQPSGPQLSDKELAQAKRKMDQLKQALQTLGQDWDFDKQKADAYFITEQRLAAEQRRQQKQEDGPDEENRQDSTTLVTPTDPLDNNTNNSNDDDDDDGIFGFMDSMEVEDEQATTATIAPTTTINWRLVDVRLPATWKGRSPKQILEEQSKTRGFVKCHYARINQSASIWQASVTLSKKHASESAMVVHLPDGLATEKPVDAEQLVAAVALFQLDPQSSIYQIMATPFKVLWLEWKQKKLEEDEAPRIAADRHRVQFILDTLNQSFDTSPKVPKPITDTSSIAPNESYENGAGSRSGLVKRKQMLFDKVQQRFNQRLTSKAYLEMKEKRKELPIADYRQEILKLVQAHQVVIISGETGCGKSTQVPQFLAENLLHPGTPYGSVICTQPRRISAMSIAQRVSQEMTDRPKSIGTKDAMVGYQIRLESKVSDENVLMFCTTGILLRQLESDPLLEGVSHVIVDEVHERSIDSDFLLVMLQRLCRLRSDLRVVLMSATVNAERFSQYFGNCPVMSVPGRTYPVNVRYLEDIVETTGYVLEEDSYYAVRKSRAQTAQGNINISGQHGSSKRVHYEIFDSDTDSDDTYQPSTQQQQSKINVLDQQQQQDNEEDEGSSANYSRQTRKMIKRMDESKINYDLIVNLLEHITTNKGNNANNDDQDIPSTGAILIFLPGMPEIRKLYDMVSAHSMLGDPTKSLLIALHSTLSSEHQEKAFDVPPKGIRKIVFATNIAETGITISDVTIVIDTGMAKIVSYDQEKRITRLRQMYVAKANVNQRKGRAGRVQEGLCYHLFTKEKYDSLANYETPEILRLPLEELCLRIKVCNMTGSIEEILDSALDAPSSKMVKNAIETLQHVQALADDETQSLTPLGVHLSHLPVDVHIGKMILFGTIFRCLDPILTIAAALSFKSPFVRPFGNEDEADKAREQFKQDDSDFLSVYKAYCVWREELLRVRGSSSGGWQRKMHQFCKRHYLSHKNLETIEEMKKQYLELLISIGFVQTSKMDGALALDQKYNLHHRLRLCQIPAVYDQYQSSVPMINAAITAGLYPKMAMYHPDSRSFVQQDMLHRTIHPSSCLFKKEPQLASPFLVYNTVVMNNDRIYLWENASIDPVTVLLLANDMTIKHHQKLVILDHWIKFNCFARTAVLIKFLRYELKTWLQNKMDDPSLDLTTTTQAVMGLMVKTLEAGH